MDEFKLVTRVLSDGTILFLDDDTLVRLMNNGEEQLVWNGLDASGNAIGRAKFLIVGPLAPLARI